MLNNRKYFSELIHTEVCIIGGGSVGMTLSRILSKYKINNCILEKEQNLTKLFSHPKAHYISPRTVEILNYFLDDQIKQEQNISISNLEYWRHYRYCKYLLGGDINYLGEIDHFKNHLNISDKLKEIKKISNALPIHIGQNKLNRLLYENVKNNYRSGFQISEMKFLSNEDGYLINCKDGNTSFKSKIVVGCDGSHSFIRNSLDINSTGQKNIQSFVNVHFISKEIADRLKLENKSAMLHFIFNPIYICVLISYDMDQGEFVLQIPYFDRVENEGFYNKTICEKIIKQLLSPDKIHVDIVTIYFNFENYRCQILENE